MAAYMQWFYVVLLRHYCRHEVVVADMGEYCFHRFLEHVCADMQCVPGSPFRTCLFKNLGTRLSIIGRHRRGEGGREAGRG